MTAQLDPTTIYAELAKPIPYKWRLKMVTNKAKKPYPDGTRGQFLAYIDARDVFNRLDAVMGLPNWQSHVKQVNDDGSVVVALSLRIDGEWIDREDVGYPNNPGAGIEEEPLKAAVSDGVKRAAIHFGIGRFLYELPPTWTEIDANGNPTRPLTGTKEHVDRSTGELHDAPAQTRQSAPVADAAPAENQPCAIEGCQGVCNGSWVGFSMRRYGVPLCSKHSALAKRGELDDELERLNEQAAHEAG